MVLCCRRYNGFFGPQHCRVVARLLGYQGIALIIDELLKTVRTLVRMTFACK